MPQGMIGLWALLATGTAAEALSLERALELARAQALEPEVARARVAQAEGRRRQALAPLLPRIEVAAAVIGNSSRATLQVVDPSKGYRGAPSRDPDAPPGTLEIVPNQIDTLQLQPDVIGSLGAQVTVPVLNAPAIARARGAGQRLDAQERLAARAEGVAQVRAWQQLLTVQAAVQLTSIGRERVRVAREQEQAAEVRFKAGALDRLGLARAKVATAAAERALRQVEANEVGSRAQLAALLGTEPSIEVGEVAMPPALEATEADEPSQLRGDLTAARALEAAAESELVASRLRLLPELDLNAQSSFSNAQNFAGAKLIWAVQARASWKLFDGGDRYGERAEREGLRREAAARSGQLQRDASREVRAARAQVDASRAALASAQDEVKFAKESLDAARAQFRAGQVGYLELLDAQSARFNAEEAQLNEGLRLGVARLELALARGSEAELLRGASSRP